jgi:hypothetical protein
MLPYGVPLKKTLSARAALNASCSGINYLPMLELAKGFEPLTL